MYVDKYIQPRMLSEYDQYIPENYRDQILNAELSAIATYEGDADTGKLVGIMVSADHQGWFEIVWVYMSKEYRSSLPSSPDQEYADVCRRILRDPG